MTDTTNATQVAAAQAAASTEPNTDATTSTQVATPNVLELTQAPTNPPATTPATTVQPTADSTPAVFEKTGEVGLDMAFDFAAKLGYKPDNDAIKAAFNGDFSLLRADLAQKGDKATGWQEFMALAERDYGKLVEQAKTRIATIEAAALEVVGGDTVKQKDILTWASAHADQSEKDEINQMFNAGPTQAKAAMMYLATLHEKATGVVIEPANAVNNQTKQTSQSYALSPAQYADELSKLVSRVGTDRVSDHPEYATLRKRRQAYQ